MHEPGSGKAVPRILKQPNKLRAKKYFLKSFLCDTVPYALGVPVSKQDIAAIIVRLHAEANRLLQIGAA